MTRAEFSAFEARVAQFLERNEIGPFTCKVDCGCQSDNFSGVPCDVCRRPLAGNRHEVSAFRPSDREVIEFRACDDCVYYVAYGTLDDETMLSIDREEGGAR